MRNTDIDRDGYTHRGKEYNDERDSGSEEGRQEAGNGRWQRRKRSSCISGSVDGTAANHE